MKRKSKAQQYIEERLTDLAEPRVAMNIAYAQEQLSLRRLADRMRAAGEWVEEKVS